MKKPQRLRAGDKIAIVCTSSGMLGEDFAIHKLDIAKKRFHEDYGLEVEVMPNALKGIEYLYKHPKARAEDLMQAFSDTSIKAVINAIGGEDSIRLLPHVDLEVIKNNPKIFTGFSDTTSVHFMMSKARIVSYYGASLLNNWTEYVEINPYTKNALDKIFFNPEERLEIPSSPYYYDDEDEKIWWKPENQHIKKQYHPETIGYEVAQGSGIVRGDLFGGCIEVMISLVGTELWPRREFFKDKIFFLETSEVDSKPEDLKLILRNFLTQGIFDEIGGILFAKPARRSRYEEYKKALLDVVGLEAGRPDLPIFCNVNFGHAEPIGVLPYGVELEMHLDDKKLFLNEAATI